jgi:site-specific DNA-methyltransferase (cytosine-N4-specific)
MQPSLLEPDLSSFFKNIHLCRDKNSLTHGLHPYPAKFIPHIPRHLLAAYADRRHPVLDPMCGSGTTLVEAAVGGFQPIGVDLNPIAVLAARAKTLLLTEIDIVAITELTDRLRRVAPMAREACAELDPPTFHNREKWFSPSALRELTYALDLVHELAPIGGCLALAAVSAVVVAVSNQESETRWCAKTQEVTPGETLLRIATRIDIALKQALEYARYRPATSRVIRADARRLPLPSQSVGTIITSPPYANSHDYYLYNKLRMFMLGYEVSPVQMAEIGSRNRHSDMKAPIEDYLLAMREVMHEWRRVLLPGGVAALVVGDAVVRGTFFDMGVQLKEVAVGAGFQLCESFQFGHRQFNAAFQRGFGTSFEKRTHVLIFRSPALGR